MFNLFFIIFRPERGGERTYRLSNDFYTIQTNIDIPENGQKDIKALVLAPACGLRKAES